MKAAGIRMAVKKANRTQTDLQKSHSKRKE